MLLTVTDVFEGDFFGGCGGDEREGRHGLIGDVMQPAFPGGVGGQGRRGALVRSDDTGPARPKLPDQSSGVTTVQHEGDVAGLGG